MKVVLREHVDHLGDRGEIVAVAPGYARNYLLPKGLALEATPGNMKVVENQRKFWEVKEAKEIADAQAIATRLGELEIWVKKKAGEAGTLYGSVTNTEIADLLEAKGVDVDRRRIVLDEPIKSLGTFEVGIKLHRHVTAQVKVQVEAEEPVADKAE